MGFHLTELPAGSTVEIIRAGGPNDGRLIGYAILFGGAWSGWSTRNLDRTVAHFVMRSSERQEAIDAVLKDWGPCD